MVENGWYHCPVCGKKLMKIPGNSVMFGVPVYCRFCKVEWYPTIYEGVEIGLDEPFPC